MSSLAIANLRTFGLAAASLTLLMTTDADFAAARPKKPSAAEDCAARGYIWADGKGCADKKCAYDGVNYEPGSTRRGPPVLGTKRVTYYCDGWTGKWESMGIKAQPSGTPSQAVPGGQKIP